MATAAEASSVPVLGLEYSEEIRQILDLEIGDDVKKLRCVEDLLGSSLEEKTRIEQELSTASTEVPSRIQSALLEAATTTEQLDELVSDYKQTRRSVTSHVTQTEPMASELAGMSQQVAQLERCMEYLKWMAMVEDLSSAVQQNLSAGAMPSAVEHFSRLAQVSQVLQGSACVNLVDFVDRTVMFWYKILREKLAGEFDEVLKALGWPFVTKSVTMPPSTTSKAELKEKLKTLLLQLLKLQLPDALAAEDKTCQDYLIIPGSTPLLLPMQLLLQPLKKRFKYHFYGKKLTNSLDKPEWYFTQVLNWIRDHTEFLERTIQPILDEEKSINVHARMEFIRGLLHIVAAKLRHDLPELLYDEGLLCHTIDELLLFDRELRASRYPASQPGCLHVLSDQACFDKWISMEKQFAIQKLDTLLSSQTAWQSQYKDMMEADESKVPQCVEGFMTLLLVITERYKVLNSPTNQLRFLDLQLDLLDDFRVRLLQVMRQEASDPLCDRYTAILNGAQYIITVLGEWSEQVFFLQLQYFSKEQSQMEALNAQLEEGRSVNLPMMLKDESPTEALSGTVFDEILSLFERLRQDMSSSIETRVVNEIKDKARVYQRDKWFSMPSPKEYIMPALSVAACDMLQTLKERLHLLRELLCASSFDRLWQDIASKLNKFIFQEVILPSQFNEGGAAQIQFDMTRGLFPLFGEFTQRPENFFKDIKEACLLLNLKRGSALLLQENIQLHQEKSKEGGKEFIAMPTPEAALNDVGVYRLSARTSGRVLGLRNDWTKT